MKFSIVFSKKALKQIKKLDSHISIFIISWLRKNIEGCSNPRQYGKRLVADRKEQWRYRIGDYRIITEIKDDKIIVLVLEVGHRRNIYK